MMFIPPPINEEDNSSSNEGDNSINPQIAATNIPTKAKPMAMPMLLRDALIAVWLAFRVALITFLVEMFVGIDSAKEASE
jgi:hypothetical protein